MPVIIAALLLGGAGLAIANGWFRGGTATTTGAPSVLASEQTATPASSSASTSASAGSSASTSAAAPSASTSSSAPAAGGRHSSTGASAADVAAALKKCQSGVRASDNVLQAAAIGVQHWSDHVQAQTDANHRDISTKQMSAIFKRTRLAGPADLARYDKARQAAEAPANACEAPKGAPQNVRTTMAGCAERSRAQRPVLDAAADAMGDWKSHLAAMRRSRMGHVHDAQGVWIRAWRAAPPHIDAYKSASSSLKAPDC